MSEIEKMYKTIFGEFAPNCSLCVKLVDCKIFNNTHNCNKFEGDYKRLFTAEKQLELIKFITSLGVCEIENWNEKGFHFAIKRDRIYPTMFLSLSNINLQETLADVINNLWQDLTEEECNQIKEILE